MKRIILLFALALGGPVYAASSDGAMHQALKLFEKGDYKRARAQFQDILRQDPSNNEAREYLLRSSPDNIPVPVLASTAPAPAPLLQERDALVAERRAESGAAGARVTVKIRGIGSEVVFFSDRIFFPGTANPLPEAQADLAWAASELGKKPSRSIQMRVVEDSALPAAVSAQRRSRLALSVLPALIAPDSLQASSWSPAPLLSGFTESR